ncbi:hypothetical protein CTH30272_03091 [Allocatenococcus thiocycli]|nr:hypothetical protein CTH30272_03091 [Catenococcus thiocycli]
MTTSDNDNEENIELVRAFIGRINNRITHLLEENKPIHRYAEEKCSGGHYAPYVRATYKPKSELEYNELKEEFRELELEYFDLLEKHDREQKAYKNFPIFIDSPVSSVSLKSNTAYKSRRYKPDAGIEVEVVTIRYSDHKEELLTKSQAEQEALDVLSKLSKYIESASIEDSGYNTIYVTVKLSDLSEYAKAQGLEHSSITLRTVSGVKYNARILTEAGESSEHKYGFIIVHPDSSLSKSGFFTPTPRAKSHRSLERTSTRLNKIGEVELGEQLEIWLIP